MEGTPEIDIKHIARLARLELSDEEQARLATQFGRILESFRALQELDLSGVEPTAHALPVYNVWREDTPGPTLPLEEALRHAPQTRDGQFVVPKIVEDA